MEKLLSGRIPNDVRTSKILAEGHAAEEILRAVDTYAIDLITIANHGLTGWRHMIFGSVAEKVVRLASIPVMTVSAKLTPEKQEEKLAAQLSR